MCYKDKPACMEQIRIKTFEFSNEGKEELLKQEKARDWPVVYLINNDDQMYIGETQNAVNRFQQHLDNKERASLKKINIIFDDEFNKSAILDIEQSLIHLFTTDQKYKLQNQNYGQSYKHNYYERQKYLNKLEPIWKELKKLNLVNNDIEDLRNSDLFKYSPYNSLTTEQVNVSNRIIEEAMKTLSKGETGTAIINGGAGTGKTIVLINLMFKLINATKYKIDQYQSDDGDEEAMSDYTKTMVTVQEFVKSHNNNKPLKIGYVCPMNALRETIKDVYGKINHGLKKDMVIGPFDVFKDTYDILLVDEAHRLTRRENLQNYKPFDERAKEIGLNPKDATQLDMIMARSKYRILVYDENQTIKKSDITSEQFNNIISHNNQNILTLSLKTQMRCMSGQQYIDYLSNIFDCKQKDFETMANNYEFKIFDDPNVLIDTIKEKDKEYGLCANAAGYSWKWKSKKYIKEGYDYIINNNLQDIKLGNRLYVWNMESNPHKSKNAINEIWCIHTLQGYDLNYVGVILGEEIDYDPIENKITINRNKFYDTNVKRGADDESLKKYIINAYKVIMSRGIRGCYVYACNKNMREYLERFIKH